MKVILSALGSTKLVKLVNKINLKNEKEIKELIPGSYRVFAIIFD